MKEKKSQYYKIQGIWGVIGILLGAFMWIAGDALLGVLFIAAGIYLIFTEDMVVTNELQFEIEESERAKESE